MKKILEKVFNRSNRSRSILMMALSYSSIIVALTYPGVSFPQADSQTASAEAASASASANMSTAEIAEKIIRDADSYNQQGKHVEALEELRKLKIHNDYAEWLGNKWNRARGAAAYARACIGLHIKNGDSRYLDKAIQALQFLYLEDKAEGKKCGGAFRTIFLRDTNSSNDRIVLDLDNLNDTLKTTSPTFTLDLIYCPEFQEVLIHKDFKAIATEDYLYCLLQQMANLKIENQCDQAILDKIDNMLEPIILAGNQYEVRFNKDNLTDKQAMVHVTTVSQLNNLLKELTNIPHHKLIRIFRKNIDIPEDFFSQESQPHAEH